MTAFSFVKHSKKCKCGHISLFRPKGEIYTTITRMKFYVYITTNPSKNALYIGMTNNLEQRIIEHYLTEVNRRHMRENTFVISDLL